MTKYIYSGPVLKVHLRYLYLSLLLLHNTSAQHLSEGVSDFKEFIKIKRLVLLHDEKTLQYKGIHFQAEGCKTVFSPAGGCVTQNY